MSSGASQKVSLYRLKHGVITLCLLAALVYWWRPALSASRGSERRLIAMKVVGYYPNYARKCRPQDIDTTPLTHILYAFANVEAETGTVFLSDKWADEEIHWEGDSWNDPGNNLYGCFKQLALMKRRQRNLKLLLSVGGWTYSQNGCFKKAGTDARARQRFVESSLTLLENYGLDGIDIDWEYPATKKEAQAYADLLRDMRSALDQTARDKGEAPYELTIAAPCGAEQAQRLPLREIAEHIDSINLMAYDFSGSWSGRVAHQANLFDRNELNAVSVDRAIRYYASQGVPINKLVIGIPLYGRSFANTNGLGASFSGVGEGTWEAGVLDYKQLPRDGAQVEFDSSLIASWSYDARRREFVSYDTAENAEAKADHIARSGLGGAMFWELSADWRPGHENAIVPRVARRLGRLDTGLNHLNFPNSKFDNLRNGRL